MTQRDPAALGVDASGTVVAVADGPELLVHEAAGEPRWKAFCDDLVVGIWCGLEKVIVLDAAGQLTHYRAGDGERLDEQQLELPSTPFRMIGTPLGVLGAVTSEGIMVVRPGVAPVWIPVHGLTAAAFGPMAGSLGVGTSNGTFAAIDPASGASWGTVSVGASVGGVAWSALGHWVVTAGEHLSLISGDGTALECSVGGQEALLGEVVCSVTGVIAAATLGTKGVAAFELHGKKRAGQLEVRREVRDLVMGPGNFIYFSFDDGDATGVDLVARQSVRTEPHAGRGRNNWRLENKVDDGALRGALAFHTAGAQPIAKYIAPPSDDDDDGFGCLAGCASCFSITFTLFAVIAGCAGLFTLLAYL